MYHLSFPVFPRITSRLTSHVSRHVSRSELTSRLTSRLTSHISHLASHVRNSHHVSGHVSRLTSSRLTSHVSRLTSFICLSQRCSRSCQFRSKSLTFFASIPANFQTWFNGHRNARSVPPGHTGLRGTLIQGRIQGGLRNLNLAGPWKAISPPRRQYSCTCAEVSHFQGRFSERHTVANGNVCGALRSGCSGVPHGILVKMANRFCAEFLRCRKLFFFILDLQSVRLSHILFMTKKGNSAKLKVCGAPFSPKHETNRTRFQKGGKKFV